MTFAPTTNKSSSMTCRHHRRSLLFIILGFLPLPTLLAQALTLQDMVKIYSLDSASAREYCTGKQLPLITAGNTGATRRYQYCTPDSSNRLEINYPNDHSSSNIQISYWFTNEEQYKKMKEDFLKLGFQRQSAEETGGSLSAYVERYLTKNLQAELIHPQGKQPYWLYLHPVGHYSE